MKYLIILLIVFTSCSKSIQPTTIKQEQQKQLRKKEHAKILNYILVFNIVCLVLLYEQVEKLDK